MALKRVVALVVTVIASIQPLTGCTALSPDLPADDSTKVPGDSGGESPSDTQLDLTAGISGDSATADQSTMDGSSSDFTSDANSDNLATDNSSADAVTATFQQGVNGYNGVRSVAISSLSAESYNGYSGTTFTDSVDWCIGDLPKDGYNESPLFRFEELGLPSGAKVVSASLTCTFSSYNSDQKVIGRYLSASWSTDPGSNGSGVGWKNRDAGVPWSVPGARGDGSDYVSGKSFEFAGLTATGWQTKTVSLDAAVVQEWVAQPDHNFGVILLVDIVNRHTGFRQPQNDHASDRPILTIRYTLK